MRFTQASLPPEIEDRLREALAKGHHGTMTWMETRIAERAHPQTLWGDAKSVIMLGMNYGPEGNPLHALLAKDRGVISIYAQGDDYHDVVKKKLKALGRWISDETGEPLKVFVDTAPVAEKPLAAQAGLGWQGKHTNLVSRAFGSWLFLGAIYCATPFPADEAEADHCGSCQSCLDICPTNAFPAPYQLDARACISYLTIEHHGPIPHEYRRAMGNRIYGCDDCLAICPWNKFAQTGQEQKLAARDELAAPSLKSLVALDDAAFRSLFRKSPVKRIGRDRFVRNVLIAIGNSGDQYLLPALEPCLTDTAPVVQGAAIWAWAELGGARETLARLRLAPLDREVETELSLALTPSEPDAI